MHNDEQGAARSTSDQSGRREGDTVDLLAQVRRMRELLKEIGEDDGAVIKMEHRDRIDAALAEVP